MSDGWPIGNAKAAPAPSNDIATSRPLDWCSEAYNMKLMTRQLRRTVVGSQSEQKHKLWQITRGRRGDTAINFGRDFGLFVRSDFSRAFQCPTKEGILALFRQCDQLVAVAAIDL
jgi:hypothetical protein